MTTAARPTFEPARGGTGKGETDLSAMSKQYSSRDLPGHTKLKYRQEGQSSSGELRSRDFRRELEDRERNVRDKRDRERGRDTSTSASSSKKPRVEQQQQQQIQPAANLDADDPLDEDDDSDSDSDDDDAAELMAELQRIKKERAQERLQKESDEKQEEERIRTENILSGNPLLNQEGGVTAAGESANFSVKRRWDDDVVFKNCARTEDDKMKGKHFINDSIRSEFHKRFMEKYIK